jgi:hypothetical protein
MFIKRLWLETFSSLWLRSQRGEGVVAYKETFLLTCSNLRIFTAIMMPPVIIMFQYGDPIYIYTQLSLIFLRPVVLLHPTIFPKFHFFIINHYFSVNISLRLRVLGQLSLWTAFPSFRHNGYVPLSTSPSNPSISKSLFEAKPLQSSHSCYNALLCSSQPPPTLVTISFSLIRGYKSFGIRQCCHAAAEYFHVFFRYRRIALRSWPQDAFSLPFLNISFRPCNSTVNLLPKVLHWCWLEFTIKFAWFQASAAK